MPSRLWLKEDFSLELLQLPKAAPTVNASLDLSLAKQSTPLSNDSVFSAALICFDFPRFYLLGSVILFLLSVIAVSYCDLTFDKLAKLPWGKPHC